MKYKKRPIEIEAFQMTAERMANNVDWPEWLNAAWQMNKHITGSLTPTRNKSDGSHEFSIHTLEGPMNVSVDDWIIQGIQGELYPCKPDIFADTYESVDVFEPFEARPLDPLKDFF